MDPLSSGCLATAEVLDKDEASKACAPRNGVDSGDGAAGGGKCEVSTRAVPSVSVWTAIEWQTLDNTSGSVCVPALLQSRRAGASKSV